MLCFSDNHCFNSLKARWLSSLKSDDFNVDIYSLVKIDIPKAIDQCNNKYQLI